MAQPTSSTTSKHDFFSVATERAPILKSDPIEIASETPRRSSGDLESERRTIKKRAQSATSDRKIIPISSHLTPSLQEKQITVFGEEQGSHSPHSPSSLTSSHSPGRRSPISHSQHMHRKKSAGQSTVPKVSILLSTFIDLIPIPVTSFSEWRNKVNVEILGSLLIKTYSSEKIQSVISDVYNKALGYSSMLNRIEKASELFKGVQEYQYLNEFIGLSNPIDFWKKYEKLKTESTSNFNVLFGIFGGEESFAIISECVKNNGNQIKLEFLRDTYETLDEYRRKEEDLLKSSYQFDLNSDVGNMDMGQIPIFMLDSTEFSNSFQACYSPRAVQRGCIRFNDYLVCTPSNPNKEHSEKQRGDIF